MALKVANNALTVASNGGIFLAPLNTKLDPAHVNIANFGQAINDASRVPAGWDILANTSRENLPSFDIDAGDTTTLGSWGNSVIRNVYATSTVTLETHPMQQDKESIARITNGWVVAELGGAVLPSGSWEFETAIVVAIVDNGYASGYYIPATDTTLTDLPKLKTDAFSELTLKSTLKSADPSVIPPKNGINGMAVIFEPIAITSAKSAA